MTFNTVLPSDVHALKVRLAPSVDLVSARVKRATTLLPALRSQWQAFATEWAAYAADDTSVFSPSNYDQGLALEGKLRDLKSVLSSQCPGVFPPAAKRPSAFFGTWASPVDVRAQKNRTDPLMRELNAAMAASPSLDAEARRTWSEFFRGWVAFFNTDDSWVHGATLYECAIAYEDAIPEWRDVLDYPISETARAPQPNPSLPSSPGGFPTPPSGYSPLGSAPPAPPPPPPMPADTGVGAGTVALAAASALALAFAFSKGKRR